MPIVARPRLQAALAAAALLASATAAAATAAAAQQPAPAGRGPATVTGTVWDSLAAAPLAGALVQIVDPDGSPRSASTDTDSAGRFRLTGVVPGRYIIGFFHPVLDALGVQAPMRALDVGTAPVEGVALFAPSGPRLREAFCGARAAADSSGILLGVVRDADDDTPLPGADVVAEWVEFSITRDAMRQDRRLARGKAGPTGGYAICDVPTDVEVTVSAVAPGRRSGQVALSVPTGGALRRDLLVGRGAVAASDSVGRADSAATADTVLRGSARLRGVVWAPNGRPVAGARVRLARGAAVAETSRSGTFALDGLPSGTHALEVRALGYAPKSVAVDLSSGRVSTTTVVLDQRAQVLDAARIYGKPTARRDITGFLERRQRGMGRYLTGEQLDRMNPFRISEALRMMPGVRLVPTRGSSNVIQMRGDARGNCAPAVFLDGVYMTDGAATLDDFVNPQDVAGIEVYVGQGFVPPQFIGPRETGCGAVVLWTGSRRTGPR